MEEPILAALVAFGVKPTVKYTDSANRLRLAGQISRPNPTAHSAGHEETAWQYAIMRRNTEPRESRSQGSERSMINP